MAKQYQTLRVMDALVVDALWIDPISRGGSDEMEKLKQNQEPMMTSKRQPSDKVQHGHSKANLGQKEAKLEKNDTELERLSEEQLRHMEGGKAAKSAQQQKTKAESK